MTEKTVLNDTHRALGARMVDFGGWDMPINYGSNKVYIASAMPERITE